jgi:serine/threonine protein phosphatase PrpC
MFKPPPKVRVPRDPVESFFIKSRMGYIPNTQKTNQDSSLFVRNLAGIDGLHMLGVMDGHGYNGDKVS